MRAGKKAPSGPVPVEAFKHEDKRLNNPPADSEALVSPEVAQHAQLRYKRNPDLDPQLVWRGKDEQDDEDLVVDAPPIYIQEKIVPRTIIENLRKVIDKPELTLFDDFDGLSGWEAVEYYEHEANWSNRMILGDSLQVMASLAEKESLRGKVQMIYIDGSVFVQIGDENVHLVRSVMDEIFGSENFISLISFATTGGAGSFAGGTNVLASVNSYIIWYCRDLGDIKYRQLYQRREVNGPGGGKYTTLELPGGSRIPLGSASDSQIKQGRILRYDTLTSQTTRVGQTTVFAIELDGQSFRPPTGGWKTNVSGMSNLLAAGRVARTGSNVSYVRYFDDFPAFPLTNNWPDIGGIQSRADPKIYVVQTSTSAIQRCMLMCTDPGDLVIDPTCGSGTTAFVAEQWGRRWITVDTSRVALALARQRIMGARFPYYLLADSLEGQAIESDLTGKSFPNRNTADDLHKGFVYERVPHVSLKSIANNPDIEPGMSRQEIDAAIKRHAEVELLYDRPYENKRKVRVSGPFTVESLSPHKTLTPGQSASEEAAETSDTSVFAQTILNNLLKAGVQNGRKNERLLFESLVPFAGEYIQAEGQRRNGAEGTPQRIAVSIGPQFGTVDPDFIRKAAREATHGLGFDLLLVCAFAFDPQAVRATEEFTPSNPTNFAVVQDERRIGRVPILLVRMNSDLAMGDVLLKKTGSGNLFMVFGEPDVAIERTDDSVMVEIRGVDVYNPTTGEIRSNGTGEIALWMIDTDYDGESFFVRHCYFTGNNDPYKRLKAALKADIDEAAWATLYSTKSRPFARPETGKIAVKVINHYGDEVLQIYDV